MPRDARLPRIPRRALDGSEVEQIPTLGETKTDHPMTASLKMLGNRKTKLAAMPGEENAHDDRIALPTPRVDMQAGPAPARQGRAVRSV